MDAWKGSTRGLSLCRLHSQAGTSMQWRLKSGIWALAVLVLATNLGQSVAWQLPSATAASAEPDSSTVGLRRRDILRGGGLLAGGAALHSLFSPEVCTRSYDRGGAPAKVAHSNVTLYAVPQTSFM